MASMDNVPNPVTAALPVETAAAADSPNPKKKRAGAGQRAVKAADGDPSVEQITQAIKAEQTKIHDQESSMVKNEAAIVASKIAIGGKLVALKAAAKKAKQKWTVSVKATGLHERVARRLMSISNSAWAKSGPEGSDLFERLPTDDQKLVALAPLTRQQLDEILERHDLKHLDRNKVIDVVKESSGSNKPPKAVELEKTLVKAVNRFAAKVVKDIKDGPEALDQRARRQVLEALDASYQTVKQALEHHDAVPAQAAAAA
jgi:hypothetical protein